MTRPDWKRMKEAIVKNVKLYGFYDSNEKNFLMSFNELAQLLNTTWLANLFVTRQDEQYLKGKKDFEYLDEHFYFLMKNRIRATIRKFGCFEHIEQDEMGLIQNEFVLYTPSLEGC